MGNGRCRFHGGKSTGPRTAADLASSRAARRTHGGCAAEIIDLSKAAAAHARRVTALRAQIAPERAENGRQKATRADKPAAPSALIVPAAGAFGRRPSAPIPRFSLDMGFIRCFSWRGRNARSGNERCNARQWSMTW
jgi:hypothetical protein